MIQSWKLGLATLVMSGVITFYANSASAQITPDSTLPNNSIVTPNGSTLNIIEGTQAGSNLFHSFGEFSVPTGGTAYFNNAADIQNIISRVTGGSISNIDGIIRANGNANLFLINPNGIVFGANASLNVGGSFVASTANAIGFGNQGFFSATNPNTPELLTVNPSALLFNQIRAASIRNNSVAPSDLNPSSEFTATGLRVPDGKSLLLVGGDINIDGGGLYAFGGRVELGGLAGAGTVGLNVNGSDLSLSFPSGVQLSDISLTNRAVVNVTAGGGGSITVNARNLEVLEGSRLLAGIGEDLGTVGSQAGDITLNATGAITIGQSSGFFSSRIENNVNRNATGNGGDINIQAESLFMSDRSLLSTNAYATGQGDAGSIFIRVSDAVNLIDNSYIDSSSTGNVPKVGDGGDIQIQAGSLLMNRAGLSASTYRSGNSRDGTYGYGQGNGGSITVEVEGAVDLIDSSIDSILGTAVTGKGGDIKIKAKSLSMTDEAILSTRTNGQGDAGDISVQVEDTISLTTSNINSFVNFYGENYRAVGNGGDIKIKAGSLFMLADAYISASTLGQGNAGDISVQVEDAVSLSNTSVINSSVNSTAEGNGGNIQVETRSLSLTGDAVITNNTRGRGNAGNIQVKASDSVNISGLVPGEASSSYSGLFTDSNKTATGQGGDISITTDALRISDRASLNARTDSAFRGGNITVDANTVEVTNGGKLVTTAFGSGEAGNINVNSTSMTISGSDPTNTSRFARRRVVSAEDGPASGLFARTEAAGAAGDLKISTEQLIVQDGAQITTSTAGAGSGGSLEVNAPQGFVQLTGSDSGLFARSDATGNAGSLTITTEQLHVLDGAEVTVSSELGQAGNLIANADSILLDKGKITAVTGAGNGGNITLQNLDLLQMRDNSLISAEALRAANGGNIKLDTQFLVAVPSENSDIIANAVEGNGGNIEITSSGIFGLQYRDRLTQESDINASSEFGLDGTVEINTPDIDPNSGLVSLPTVPVDTQVSQACTPSGNQAQNEFVVTGRGGLPPSPDETLSTDAVQVDWVTLNPTVENRNQNVSTNITTPEPNSMVEATGWTLNDQGEVILTASATPVLPANSKQTPAKCLAN